MEEFRENMNHTLDKRNYKIFEYIGVYSIINQYNGKIISLNEQMYNYIYKNKLYFSNEFEYLKIVQNIKALSEDSINIDEAFVIVDNLIEVGIIKSLYSDKFDNLFYINNKIHRLFIDVDSSNKYQDINAIIKNNSLNDIFLSLNPDSTSNCHNLYNLFYPYTNNLSCIILFDNFLNVLSFDCFEDFDNIIINMHSFDIQKLGKLESILENIKSEIQTKLFFSFQTFFEDIISEFEYIKFLKSYGIKILYNFDYSFKLNLNNVKLNSTNMIKNYCSLYLSIALLFDNDISKDESIYNWPLAFGQRFNDFLIDNEKNKCENSQCNLCNYSSVCIYKKSTYKPFNCEYLQKFMDFKLTFWYSCKSTEEEKEMLEGFLYNEKL